MEMGPFERDTHPKSSYLWKSSNVGPAKTVILKRLAGAKQVQIKVSFETDGGSFHVILFYIKKNLNLLSQVRGAGPGAALRMENQFSKVVWKVQRSAKLPPEFQPWTLD